VLITGPRRNPFPFVRAAHIGVTASTQEAFGRSTLEYLTIGKPVIAASSGGSAELVDSGINGYLFDSNSETGLVDALLHYVSNPSLIDEHGTAAQRKAEEFLPTSKNGSGSVFDELRPLMADIGSPRQPLPNVVASWLQLPETVDRYNSSRDPSQ
jgi:glycosyltransferase involved in cell wall biosynthesis